LKALNERLQLEENYSRLMPSTYKTGMKYAKSILAAGTTVASIYALTKTPMMQDLVKSLA